MDKTSRALRRHHDARLLRYTKRYLTQNYWCDPQDYDEDELHIRARRTYKNRAVCSCSTCGNGRRNPWYNGKERLTMPERKQEDSMNDQIVDYFSDIEDNWG